MKKFLSTILQREFFFLILLPFLLWITCFWAFISGQASITMDGDIYYQQICFFADNMLRGVYPLWDPTWFDGSPFNFFLRRMGELNPFYWIIVGLKAVGVANLYAYTIFLSFYFFLAATGFWLISRILLKDRLAYTGAFWIFLFSAFGAQLFYNYIILMLVPLVWFFYFLLSFAKEGKRYQFLGIFFTSSLVVITYIPFFFLTVVLSFFMVCPLFFWKDSYDFIIKSLTFIRTRKAFALMCLLFFLVACIPAVDFYRSSRQGDFVMPGRNTSAQESSVLAVGMEHVKVGDLLAQGYFDRLFQDHSNLISGDFFIAYFFFLVCLISIFNPLTRRSALLLTNVFILWLICMTDTTPLYKFLYDHVFFFRYMRMISFLFWIALLPMMILLAMEQLGIFLKEYRGSKNPYLFWFILIVHILFTAGLLMQQDVIWTTWLTLAFSLTFFTGALNGWWNGRILLLIMLLTIVPQIMGMCFYISRNVPRVETVTGKFEQMSTDRFILNKKNPVDQNIDGAALKRQVGDVYYGTPWYSDIYKNIPVQEAALFVSNKLYLVDNTMAHDGNSREFFYKLGLLWREKGNVALLPQDQVQPGDVRSMASASAVWDIVNDQSKSVKVTGFDVNTLKLKVNLDRSRFLIWSDNYHPDWHVFINGKEDRVFRTDHAFKGVWLPAGESSVLFRYATPLRYLMAYAMIFLFAFALAMIIFLAVRERFCAGEGALDDL